MWGRRALLAAAGGTGGGELLNVLGLWYANDASVPTLNVQFPAGGFWDSDNDPVGIRAQVLDNGRERPRGNAELAIPYVQTSVRNAQGVNNYYANFQCPEIPKTLGNRTFHVFHQWNQSGGSDGFVLGHTTALAQAASHFGIIPGTCIRIDGFQISAIVQDNESTPVAVAPLRSDGWTIISCAIHQSTGAYSIYNDGVELAAGTEIPVTSFDDLRFGIAGDGDTGARIWLSTALCVQENYNPRPDHLAFKELIESIWPDS